MLLRSANAGMRARVRTRERRLGGRGLALAMLSCARIEPPPGGPPDAAPPQLIATRPDSLARLPDFEGDVEFRFDEIISEGGAPTRAPAPATWRSWSSCRPRRGCPT